MKEGLFLIDPVPDLHETNDRSWSFVPLLGEVPFSVLFAPFTTKLAFSPRLLSFYYKCLCSVLHVSVPGGT